MILCFFAVGWTAIAFKFKLKADTSTLGLPLYWVELQERQRCFCNLITCAICEGFGSSNDVKL